MKKLILLAIAVLALQQANAHFLWLETGAKGKPGQSHEVRVYFGEYSLGQKEKTDGHFTNAEDFTLHLISPEGKKTILNRKAAADHYTASFVPKVPGVYRVVLTNNNVQVVDYTEYDLGIFKTEYASVATIYVGAETSGDQKASSLSKLEIIPLEEGEGISLQLLYDGKPLAENELKVFLPGGWEKTLHTGEDGKVSFSLPWNERYVVETSHKEQVPGTFKDKDYEYIWHFTTYSIAKE
ncbi:DUF4198 domain-containing protein [Sinomicrobium weinanense]|uniref:DUF4198 domain-containing protein n=1 Tax=Sinomicrobium weinanense TaxID=2842200 RepID=A0A926JRD8_9FLAO|nr:DUF4198 domain-containing protein [Sinomicrobium weinanense]MBC9795976.1 DUF4198 domain-containing protein [Sinomicrobium weinanense]MBU3122095.1 DUF4198 domain-containing protein [Sinomicrobium weinanense]